VFGDAAAQDSAPIMRDHEKAVQHAKDQRRHGKEVHRSNGFTVIAQKRRPSLCRFRTPWRLPHPAQHGPLGNVEAEHPQFAMNARRTHVGFSATMRKVSSQQFNADALPAEEEPGIALYLGLRRFLISSPKCSQNFWLARKTQKTSPIPG
jgi:hypothetical protein